MPLLKHFEGTNLVKQLAQCWLHCTQIKYQQVSRHRCKISTSGITAGKAVSKHIIFSFSFSPATCSPKCTNIKPLRSYILYKLTKHQSTIQSLSIFSAYSYFKFTCNEAHRNCITFIRKSFLPQSLKFLTKGNPQITLPNSKVKNLETFKNKFKKLQ